MPNFGPQIVLADCYHVVTFVAADGANSSDSKERSGDDSRWRADMDKWSSEEDEEVEDDDDPQWTQPISDVGRFFAIMLLNFQVDEHVSDCALVKVAGQMKDVVAEMLQRSTTIELARKEWAAVTTTKYGMNKVVSAEEEETLIVEATCERCEANVNIHSSTTLRVQLQSDGVRGVCKQRLPTPLNNKA